MEKQYIVALAVCGAILVAWAVYLVIYIADKRKGKDDDND